MKEKEDEENDDDDKIVKEFLTNIAKTFEENQLLAIISIGNEKLRY